MPIYEYECASCHHHFDLIQKINDEPAKQCPQCLQDTAVKLVSAAGFQLKGTGWYATDFKTKSTTTSSTTDKKDASCAAGNASSKECSGPCSTSDTSSGGVS